MKYFSNKFYSLIESMKSESPILEKRDKDRTASGDRVSKVKRKQKRYEDRFSEASGKFKMKAFIDALTLLRDQLIAEVSSIMNTARSGSAGYKYYETNLDAMSSLKNRVIDLLVQAYGRDKTESGELEAGQDDTVINTFRNQYNEIVKEYEDLSKKWVDAKNKDLEERPVDQNNRELEEKIQEIKDLLDGAKTLLIPPVVGYTGSTGGNQSGKIELTDTIVERKAAYTGKEAETIKAVKLLIYNKYKSTKLAEQPDWQIVYKNPSNPGPTLRANTANVIRGVKAGLVKKYTQLSGDTTGNITKAFVDVLTSLKESLSNSYKIVTFSDFMRNKVNESDDFDIGAALSAMKKGRSSSSSSKSSSKSSPKASTITKSSNVKVDPKDALPELSPTPFKNKEEGDKFRKWVNEKHPDWAKENNLDATGSENNTYIRKAWKEYGSKYTESTKEVDIKTLSDSEISEILKIAKSNNPRAFSDKSEAGKFVASPLYLDNDSEKTWRMAFIDSNCSVTYRFYRAGTNTAYKEYIGKYNKSTGKVKFNNKRGEVSLQSFLKGSCGWSFITEERMFTKRLSIEKIAEFLGKDLKWDEEGRRWFVEGYLNISINYEIDINKLYIFFDDIGYFYTGTKSDLSAKIEGTWDNGGKSITPKPIYWNRGFEAYTSGKAITGDNLKSTLLKVFQGYPFFGNRVDGVTAG